MEQKRNKEDLQQQQGTTKNNQGLTPRENDQDTTTAADKNKQGKMPRKPYTHFALYLLPLTGAKKVCMRPPRSFFT